jgi:predicted TIM-barrel fold metal-dependent hydrolase
LTCDRLIDYTPKPATREDASAFLSHHGITRSVIVLPSVYGIDNRVLIDALEYIHGSARGVAVIDPDNITDDTLEEFHQAGVRGVRVNYGNQGTDEEIIESVEKNAAIARKHDWLLQIWVPLRSFRALHKLIPTLGIRVVADHFAHAEVGSRTGNHTDTTDPYQKPGFKEVIDLVQRKLLWVKLSAPYQNSKDAPLYKDMNVIAQELLSHGPDMVVYGSDWPHTSSKEGNAAAGGRLFPQDYRVIDDAKILAQYQEWCKTSEHLQNLFVDNPRRLWGWDE